MATDDEGFQMTYPDFIEQGVDLHYRLYGPNPSPRWPCYTCPLEYQRGYGAGVRAALAKLEALSK
jgi:hypothetical protein